MIDLFPTRAKALDLRPYQLAAVEAVRAHIRAGKRNIILCAPTGSGKTVIGSHLLDECSRKMRRAAFVVDRITLTDQTSTTLDGYGVAHGVIQGNHPRYRPWERIQVASAQTLARRKWPDTDLIIVDEAHTVMQTVKDRIEARDTVCIGLTATPFTRGLGKLYDALVNVTTTNALIAEGFLSPFRIWAPSEPDMTGVKVVAGEWEEAETSKRALAIVGDCVQEYIKRGEGRKFLVSCVDVAHGEELARQFNDAGIRVEVYSYKTSDSDRARMVEEFRRPDSRIRGLISPVALTKGFDVPDVSCLIMARPLRSSLAEFIQFFGRGLRIAPAKKDCIVLDHSGNTIRFAAEWTEFFETGALELDDGKPKPKKTKDEAEEPRMVRCPSCAAVHRPLPRCPICGHEHPRKVRVAHEAGELRELIANGDSRRMAAEIWPQVCTYARRHREEPNAEKMALALYRQMTGKWPPYGSYAKTRSEPLTAAVEGQIRRCQIAYDRAKRAAKRAMDKAAMGEVAA